MRPPIIDRACRSLALAVLAFTLAWPVRAANTYATIEFVEGPATIVDAKGAARAARVGGTILEGETIDTGRDGEVHARTADHGLVAVRPDSTIRIETYRAQADAQDTSVLSLVKGTLRSITGWIGKYQRDRYVLKTTIATIGIRGTDHEPLYIPPGAAATGPPGTYDKVNSGGTYLETRSGRVNIEANRAGFAPHDGAAPRVLDRIPDFYKPTRNEGRIQARKAQLEKEMEQMRLERQKAAQAEKEKAAQAEKEKAQKAAEGKDKSEASIKDKSEKADSGEKSEKEEHRKATRRRHPIEKK